jgi:hypothetical protein
LPLVEGTSSICCGQMDVAVDAAGAVTIRPSPAMISVPGP